MPRPSRSEQSASEAPPRHEVSYVQYHTSEDNEGGRLCAEAGNEAESAKVQEEQQPPLPAASLFDASGAETGASNGVYAAKRPVSSSTRKSQSQRDSTFKVLMERVMDSHMKEMNMLRQEVEDSRAALHQKSKELQAYKDGVDLELEPEDEGDQQEGDETAARPMTKKMRLENSKTLPFVTSRTQNWQESLVFNMEETSSNGSGIGFSELDVRLGKLKAGQGQGHARCNLARRIVKHPRFDMVSASMILMNALVLGCAVHWRALSNTNGELDSPAFLQVLNEIAFVWFTVELLLRIFAIGPDFILPRHDFLWNWFDAIVVLSEFVERLAAAFIGDSESSNQTQLSVLRLLRCLRITRALRIIKLVRVFREFRMMVLSILVSMPSLVWSMVLLLMDMFLFGVYLTESVTYHLSDKDRATWTPADTRLHDFFGSMYQTLYTMFMAVTGGISWVEITNPLNEVHWHLTCVFMLYVFFTLFALTNIITGIFVEGAIQCAQNDHEEVIEEALNNQESAVRQLMQIFLDADRDSSGMVSEPELAEHLADAKVAAHFAHLGLDINDAKGLFELVDVDCSGTVSIAEFVTGCMRLKGSARAIDLATLMTENKRLSRMFARFALRIEEAFGIKDTNEEELIVRAATSNDSLKKQRLQSQSKGLKLDQMKVGRPSV